MFLLRFLIGGGGLILYLIILCFIIYFGFVSYRNKKMKKFYKTPLLGLILIIVFRFVILFDFIFDDDNGALFEK